LQNIYDRLPGATMAEHLSASGAYALDDSGVDSAARGKRRRPTAATERAEAERAEAERAEAERAEAERAEAERAEAEVTDSDIAGMVEHTGTSFDPDAAGVTAPVPTTTAPTSCSATSRSPSFA